MSGTSSNRRRVAATLPKCRPNRFAYRRWGEEKWAVDGRPGIVFSSADSPDQRSEEFVVPGSGNRHAYSKTVVAPDHQDQQQRPNGTKSQFGVHAVFSHFGVLCSCGRALHPLRTGRGGRHGDRSSNVGSNGCRSRGNDRFLRGRRAKAQDTPSHDGSGGRHYSYDGHNAQPCLAVSGRIRASVQSRLRRAGDGSDRSALYLLQRRNDRLALNQNTIETLNCCEAFAAVSVAFGHGNL